MITRLRELLAQQRGNVLLFTTVSLIFMLVLGGFAIDFLFQATARQELQRSIDAAALAGAGNLGFDSSVFPTARAAARQYGLANPYRTGTVTLALNPGNDPAGDIVLGIWQTGAFAPSLDGSRVNAVRCQYQASVPTSFLRLLGVNSLPIVADAVAIANPPALPGCGEPVLPIAVVPCAFYDAGTGAFNNSNGCGTGLSWISSNRICDQSASSPQSCNTAAWASLDGTNWTQGQIQDAIRNAGSANPTCNVTAASGSNTYVDNGMVQPTFNLLRDTFIAKRTATLPGGDVMKFVDGQPVVAYPASKGGWETGVTLVQSACPPGPLTSERQILNYSKFVVTQVYDQNRGCVITPNPDPQAEAYCSTRDPSLRAVFGYFRCDQFGTVATLDPVPRSALAPKLRLVR